MAKIKIEVDGKTLREAKDLAEDLGLDLQSVTRAFYRQIVREGRIPLDLSMRAPQPAFMPAPPVPPMTRSCSRGARTGAATCTCARAGGKAGGGEARARETRNVEAGGPEGPEDPEDPDARC